MIPLASANTRAGTSVSGSDVSSPNAPKNGRARAGPTARPRTANRPNPTRLSSKVRCDGRRSHRLAAGARRRIARKPRTPRTTIASSRRQAAGGDAMFVQSRPVGSAAGGGIRPKARLAATGTGPAQAQRTGASRRMATSVPATSATRTARRVSRMPAARITSTMGRSARAAPAGSRGRAARTVTARRCCR